MASEQAPTVVECTCSEPGEPCLDLVHGALGPQAGSVGWSWSCRRGLTE
jgi:hypothetical protein